MESNLAPFRDVLAIPLRNGLTRPKSVRGSGEKMVNMGELFAHGRIEDIAMDRVPVSERERVAFSLACGDLLFARQSLVLAGAGKCSIYLGRDFATFESHIIRARINQDIADPLYYYYYFCSGSGRSKIESIVEQVAAAGIRGSDLAALEVPLPGLAEQRAITSILGALDDKIELNRRMSATLEAMARALFKSWFVDFAPVRAKAEGRDPGLPPEIAALFPDSFETSELGEIPKGWSIGTLSNISSLNPESWSAASRPDVIRYLDLSTVKWGTVEAEAIYEQRAAPSRAQRILRPGDTIVGTVRPANGSYTLVAEHGLTGSTGFAVLRPTKSAALTYLAATAKDNIERLGRLADGAAYPAVRPEVVAATRVTLSHDAVVKAFDAVALPFLSRCSCAQRESRTLAALRDALLPKLISGEIRVRDAELLVDQSA